MAEPVSGMDSHIIANVPVAVVPDCDVTCHCTFVQMGVVTAASAAPPLADDVDHTPSIEGYVDEASEGALGPTTLDAR